MTYEGYSALKAIIENNPLTPEKIRRLVKGKVNSIRHEPIICSGGVEIYGEKYNIVLNDLLYGHEKIETFVHEIAHISYAEPTLSLQERNKIIENELESLIEEETSKFMHENPSWVNGLIPKD